ILPGKRPAFVAVQFPDNGISRKYDRRAGGPAATACHSGSAGSCCRHANTCPGIRRNVCVHGVDIERTTRESTMPAELQPPLSDTLDDTGRSAAESLAASAARGGDPVGSLHRAVQLVRAVARGRAAGASLKD